LYDEQINNGAWLIVFLKDRFNGTDVFNPYFSKLLGQL